ncbi:MAG: hypothetical protein JJE23_01430, partial [Thermoleophilia bacterium]|nr:hypothetical protein [Thermoleophilia bacterium]
RKCSSVWANPKVSIPNGIPSISQRSGLAYGISQSRGVWGARGLNWKNGRSEFFASPIDQHCSEEMLGFLEAAGVLAFLQPTLDELPNSCENSTYAATEVGPGKTIWTGTFYGLTIYRPK